MKFILEKKIHPTVMVFLLYFSFCVAGWYSFRGALVLFASEAGGIFATSIVCNDITAFLMAGVLSILLYEFITRAIFRLILLGANIKTDRLRYTLRFFIFFANILLCLFRLLYIPFPLFMVYGEIFAMFFAYGIFLVLYLIYINKYFIPKANMHSLISKFCITYLTASAVIAIINLIIEVM